MSESNTIFKPRYGEEKNINGSQIVDGQFIVSINEKQIYTDINGSRHLVATNDKEDVKREQELRENSLGLDEQGRIKAKIYDTDPENGIDFEPEIIADYFESWTEGATDVIKNQKNWLGLLYAMAIWNKDYTKYTLEEQKIGDEEIKKWIGIEKADSSPYWNFTEEYNLEDEVFNVAWLMYRGLSGLQNIADPMTPISEDGEDSEVSVQALSNSDWNLLWNSQTASGALAAAIYLTQVLSTKGFTALFDWVRFSMGGYSSRDKDGRDIIYAYDGDSKNETITLGSDDVKNKLNILTDSTVFTTGDVGDYWLPLLYSLGTVNASNIKKERTAREELLDNLNTVETIGEGEYISSVSQTDGKIEVTKAPLPTYSFDTGTNDGTIKVNDDEVKVAGLGSAAYQNKEYFATSDEVSVNSQNITDNATNIKANTASIGVNTANIATNTTNIVTIQNSLSEDYYTKKDTDNQIAAAVANAGHLKREIVSTLPTTGEDNVIYMVSNGGSGDQRYDEYMYINNTFEKIGDTKADLTDYAKTVDVNTQIEAVSGRISALNYSDEDKKDGKYVSSVSQTDGKIEVTKASLPTYSFETGTGDGTIKVTKTDSDGEITETDVAVKGLGSAAYVDLWKSGEKYEDGDDVPHEILSYATHLFTKEQTARIEEDGRLNGKIIEINKKIDDMDYSLETENGQYISSISQTDGKITAETEWLPPTYSFETGTDNGTIKVTKTDFNPDPDKEPESTDVAVKGLGSAAYVDLWEEDKELYKEGEGVPHEILSYTNYLFEDAGEKIATETEARTDFEKALTKLLGCQAGNESELLDSELVGKIEACTIPEGLEEIMKGENENYKGVIPAMYDDYEGKFSTLQENINSLKYLLGKDILNISKLDESSGMPTSNSKSTRLDDIDTTIQTEQDFRENQIGLIKEDTSNSIRGYNFKDSEMESLVEEHFGRLWDRFSKSGYNVTTWETFLPVFNFKRNSYDFASTAMYLPCVFSAINNDTIQNIFNDLGIQKMRDNKADDEDCPDTNFLPKLYAQNKQTQQELENFKNNATFQNLQIGNFCFVPRDDGSLSFRLADTATAATTTEDNTSMEAPGADIDADD